MMINNEKINNNNNNNNNTNAISEALLVRWFKRYIKFVINIVIYFRKVCAQHQQTDKRLHWLFNIGRYTAWWKWRPPRHRGALHTNGVSSTCTTSTDRQTASLTVQCRQVHCLVEMAPSAPSWRPPHQRGEFDGFPGRRERPNKCRNTTIVSGLFNMPNPQKKSQKKNRTMRAAKIKKCVPRSQTGLNIQ
jgi:hypothetical protein